MIKKITIRDIATFDKRGIVMDNLQKVNIIYGGNGAGKTTTSRVLEYGYAPRGHKQTADTTIVKPWKYPTCEVDWDGEPARVLVYNKDFREESLKETIPGVYTLGDKKMVEDAETELASLRKSIKECQRIYDQLVEESKKKRTPANETEEAIGAAKSGLDSINEALRLNGYTGFSIQPSGKKHGEFQIQREDGSYVRNTLSEGEATIITFLYFIQMVEGNIGGESSAGKKVVVIDDPICSLDYISIALVSTLTNALIEKARKCENGIEQVFVLTHNTSFHKQISVEQPKNKTSYWKLYKKDGVSRVAAFGGDNPVRNDYQAMWDKLLDEGSDETDVEKKNLMRRIIETYFLQYGGMDWEQLYDGEQMVDWDMEKFRGIFEKMGHLSHYEMMVRGK